MHVEEVEVPQLKLWIIKKLEEISADADSDVLADYVLALCNSDESDDQIKQNCLESLADFLPDKTELFVNDVLEAIRLKSYMPGYVAPRKPSLHSSYSFNPPIGPAAASTFYNQSGPQAQQVGPAGDHNGQGRKRTLNDREGGDLLNGQDTHYSRGDRQQKQIRRGRDRGARQEIGTGRGGFQQQQQNAQAGFPGLQSLQMPGMPTMPSPPPGITPFDPQNPMGTITAMQAMGFPLPGFPHISGQSMSPIGDGHRQGLQGSPPAKMTGERCKDYDTKGFCSRGASCPYEHGVNHLTMPDFDEYDPKNATIAVNARDSTHAVNGQGMSTERERGRGRGRGEYRGGFHDNRGGKRAPFSQAGPNHDRSNTSIVVEQIPEDKFSDEAVRGFFGEFGTIEDVQMQSYKRLAIVRFSNWNEAKAAYQSPKVIFDNRFVKVYWYKPEGVPEPPKGYRENNGAGGKASYPDDDEMQIDPAEFEKKQAEAQKAHDEKTKKIKEAEEAKLALERQIKTQQEEARKLREKLAQKAGTLSASPAPGGDASQATEQSGDAKKNEATTALRAKLAALEAEAQRLGVPAEEGENGWSGGRGRGGSRGRGGFPPRGRGYDPSFRGRGGYRGWGGFRGGVAGGAVKRLDNRPKSVEVKTSDGAEWDERKDEALRGYLFGVGEFDTIIPSPDPSRKDSAIVCFKERYIAEMLMNGGPEIPGLGKVEMSWVATPQAAAAAPPAATAAQQQQTKGGVDSDVLMGEGGTGSEGGAKATGDVDYDVAEDEDRW